MGYTGSEREVFWCQIRIFSANPGHVWSKSHQFKGFLEKQDQMTKLFCRYNILKNKLKKIDVIKYRYLTLIFVPKTLKLHAVPRSRQYRGLALYNREV